MYSEIGGKMVFQGINAAPFFDALDGITLSNVIWFKEESVVKYKTYVSSSTLILKTIDILKINKKLNNLASIKTLLNKRSNLEIDIANS